MSPQLAILCARPLVGREIDVGKIRALVQKNGVLVVHGPPGVGKTRLLAEVARLEPSRGLLWMSMRGITENALFHRLAEVLGLGVIATTDSALRAECVRILQRMSTYLLIVDNLDLPVSAVQQLVEIAIAAPNGAIAVSSRFSWATTPETPTYHVSPLDETSTLQLLASRFEENGLQVEPTRVATIARLLGGMPLAVEVAVAVAAKVGIDAAVERLSSGAVHDRVANSILTSTDALALVDQEVLFAASMLAAQFEAKTVADLVDRPLGDIIDALERLVEANLAYPGPARTFLLYPFVAETMRHRQAALRFREVLLQRTAEQLRILEREPLRARLPVLLSLEPQIARSLRLYVEHEVSPVSSHSADIHALVEAMLVLATDCYQKLDGHSVLRHPVLFAWVEKLPNFRMMEAMFAINEGRIEEAQSILVALDAEPDLSHLQRQQLHGLLASVHWCRTDLAKSLAHHELSAQYSSAEPGGRRAYLFCTRAILRSLHSGEPIGVASDIFDTTLELAASESMGEERRVRVLLAGMLFARGAYERLLDFAAADPLTRLGLQPDFEITLYSLYALIHLNRLDEASRNASEALTHAESEVQATRIRVGMLAMSLKQNHSTQIQAQREMCRQDQALPPSIEAFRQALLVLAAIAVDDSEGLDNTMNSLRSLVPDDSSPFGLYRQVSEKLVAEYRRSGEVAECAQAVRQLSDEYLTKFDSLASIRSYADLALRLCEPPLILVESRREARLNGLVVSLARRPALWIALSALAAAHRTREPIMAADIYAAAWPDDRSTSTSRGNRVRVTMHYLKQLGLQCIESGRDGHRLRADLPLWLRAN